MSMSEGRIQVVVNPKKNEYHEALPYGVNCINVEIEITSNN